ncbi:unnamed protein product [Urochloa humidicola]
MEAAPRKHETTRGEPAAAAAGDVGGGLGALRPLEVIVRCLRAAVAFFLFWGCLGGLGALLRRLVEFEPGDRRLQAATFFLASGACTVLSGTALNQSVNPEHIFAGFFLLNLGAAMAILTLAGDGPGRAAAQMERFLRRFF